MPVTYATQVARGRGLCGAVLREHMRGYNQTAGIDVHGECLASAGNRVGLAEERDERGLPKPWIRFSAGENERRLGVHTERVMRAIWDAAGAEDVWAFPRFAHTVGTGRIGSEAASAVVDGEGRSLEVANLYVSDNSTFPSSLTVNPALTIMALSLRTADRFLARARRGEA